LNAAKPSLRRLAPGLVVAVALLGAVFIAVDYGQIRSALGQASWSPIPYALAATLVSYICISYSFARVSRLLGIHMRLRDLTAVGFVTTVLNHLVSSGGAAGYSVRFVVMGRHGASLREVIATSILHFYLTSLVMMAMLPVGLVYFLLHSSVSPTAAALLTTLASLVLLASVLAAGLVFWGAMRKKVIDGLVRAARALIRRDVAPAMERFEATMTLGVQAIRRQPMSIILIMMLIATDWACSAGALWFCFRALGVTLDPGQLISGFVIGTVAGVASMIPGGLGVQEGSMAGLFSLLGVSLERALLASILFRVVYFMVPYAISLGFYWRLLHAGGIGGDAGEWGV
jgi:uncharacterized protein (TIRG00374 family)